MSHRGRALVVEDEPSVATTVAMALRGDGWTVNVADSGDRALELMAAATFDLLLLDLRLPGIQGAEVLRRLAASATRSIPKVVVTTAYGSPDRTLEVMRLGASDILRKPFTPDELREVVAGAVARESDPAAALRAFADAVTTARDRLSALRVPPAAEAARRAIAHCPARPEGFHLLAACYDLLGEEREAVRLYRLALAVDPGYIPSRHNLDRLVLAHGARGSVEVG